MRIFVLTEPYELRVSRKSHLRDHPSRTKVETGSEKEGAGWWGGQKNNLLLRIGNINMENSQMILPGISERIISGSRLMPSTSPRWWSSSSMLLPTTGTQSYDMSRNIIGSKKTWDISQSEMITRVSDSSYILKNNAMWIFAFLNFRWLRVILSVKKSFL